jgi:hypothetical protein
MTTTLYAATRKGLFAFVADGAAWRLKDRHFIGDPVSAVLPDRRDRSLYAALNLGHFGVKLRRSRDGGVSWRECAAPAFAPASAGDTAREGPSVALIWSLECGGRDESGVLWAGTIPGGLFRSCDGGDSWELNTALWDRPERAEWFGGGYDQPGIHSICIDPRDARHLLLGVSCGGVWESRDAGASWQSRAQGMRAAYMPPARAYDPNVQDPHRLVQCTADPQALWVQHHNGIFRSRDGAASWQEITTAQPSSFGFAVAVHPADADTAWFVPAVKDECRVPVDGRLVVTRTRDGGETFEVLGQGLPAPPAFDLVYRHGLDVAPDAEWLAMGSTTGSLWVSADQGESWQCLSTHLPPIYAVRFA